MNERSPLGASRREDTSPLTNKGYSEYGGGRNDPLAMLKMHGEFLEKLRSRAKEEVSDEHSHTMNTIDLTGKINALIADIQHKNEIIEELSEEIEEMREIERENKQLKKDNGIIIAKCQEYVEVLFISPLENVGC